MENFSLKVSYVCVVDGGETEDLLEAISSEEIDNETLQTMLIESSPLSDVVLTALFDHRDSLASSEFTDIFIPNTPVSKVVYSNLEIKLGELEEEDADTVSELQVYNPNYRTLTAIRREINSNEMEYDVPLAGRSMLLRPLLECQMWKYDDNRNQSHFSKIINGAAMQIFFRRFHNSRSYRIVMDVFYF